MEQKKGQRRVTPDHLHAAYYCAAEVMRRRQRTGQPIPEWLRRHYAQLDAAIRAMSSPGHESDCGVRESEEELITAREAAELLGVSKRQAQRLAPDLDGRIVGGRWLYIKATVVEYARAKT